MSIEKLSTETTLGFYKLTPNQFATEVTAAIEAYKAKIAVVKAIAKANWNNSIQPLEEAAERLDKIWSMLEHENAVCNTPEIREVYEQLLKSVTNLYTDIMQDEVLFKIYNSLSTSDEFANLSAPQQVIIKHALRDFVLSGVNLLPDKRAEYKQLLERLSGLESNFANNVLDATEGWSYHITVADKVLLDGLPQHILNSAKAKAVAQEKSGWVLSLDSATYYGVLSYASNRQLREEFYNAYTTRASDQGPMAGKWDNTPIIAEITHIRQQIAQLIGHANYAEYSLVAKMAKDTQQVNDFLLQLAQKVKPQARHEFNNLREFAKAQGFMQNLEAWDLAYYTEKMRIAKYDISTEELRSYFPEPRVLQGLFRLVERVFGLKVQEVSGFVTWHDSVRMFAVLDQDHKLRGYFYIDLYSRDGKRGGAWMAECLSRIKFADKALQPPIAYLTCNFAAPANGKSGLLTHDDVVTLFHEFGHTLHHILTQVDYYGVSGLNGVAWDAVELPSQFMENWAWEWQVISDISENINTGEKMPRELFDRLLASKNFQSGMYLLRQLELSYFDFRLHENLPKDAGKSAHAILQEVRDEIAVVPSAPNNRFENNFGHIFAGGYAAGYYSYLWAEVLSSNVFAKFKDKDLFNLSVGQEFLSKILEVGGSVPAMDMFVNFVGHEPQIDALLESYGVV